MKDKDIVDEIPFRDLGKSTNVKEHINVKEQDVLVIEKGRKPGDLRQVDCGLEWIVIKVCNPFIKC